MSDPTPELPAGWVWQPRPFPDANFLLLLGEQPSLIDTGFVAHAAATVGLAHAHTRAVTRVANTHWHSDHVGGNALLQQAGAEIVGAAADADALDRADPGCCLSEYLDQPVPRYRIDRPLGDGDRVLLGDTEWTTLAVPGHTPGDLAYWNSEHQILAAGDTLSTYDVGWVNVMCDGMTALDTAINSLARLQELGARLILPGHGPIVEEPGEAIAKSIQRLRRQREDVDHAVNYGAKRILAYALMIRDGMRASELEKYLGQRAWAKDCAAMLGLSLDEFARELVDPMLTSGALTLTDGVLRASAETSGTDRAVFDLPFPSRWAAADRPGVRELDA